MVACKGEENGGRREGRKKDGKEGEANLFVGGWPADWLSSAIPCSSREEAHSFL